MIQNSRRMFKIMGVSKTPNRLAFQKFNNYMTLLLRVSKSFRIKIIEFREPLVFSLLFSPLLMIKYHFSSLE